MLVDIRWVILVVTVAGLIWLSKRDRKWVAPIGLGVAAATLLIILLGL
jgi:hypothetical protein